MASHNKLEKPIASSTFKSKSDISEEEEDYMNENFIKNLENYENSAKTGPKSGTIINKTYSQLKYERKRKIEEFDKNAAMEAKLRRQNKAEKTENKKLLEKSQLETGLNQPIATSNIGFKLLSKMGFQGYGTCLGSEKNVSNLKRLTEPIKIDTSLVKSNKIVQAPRPSKFSSQAGKNDGWIPKSSSNRPGFGVKTAEKELELKNQEILKNYRKNVQKSSENLKINFAARNRTNFLDKNKLKDLAGMQKLCWNLDQKLGNLEPKEKYFWPENYLPSQETTSDGDEDTESQEETGCLPENLSIDQKISNLHKFLREDYFYCFYCGIQFENLKDLEENCPGFDKDLH